MIPKLKRAKVSALLLPGIGTVEHLHIAKDCGVATIRVATHCTEADVSEQHIALSRKLGLDTVGFLMMAHMVEPAQLLAQAKLMESYGANCIYCTDSAGYMLPDDVTARIGLLREKLSPATEIGFHGHHNMALGIANSLAAIEAGAGRIDGSVAGLGAGAGNTPLEVFNAVLDRMGVHTGIDVFKLMDVAEDIVVPMMDQPIRVDRDSLILGYAGVYSSFLLHAKRAGAKYGVPSARHPGRARTAEDRRRPGGHDRGRGAQHVPRAEKRARRGVAAVGGPRPPRYSGRTFVALLSMSGAHVPSAPSASIRKVYDVGDSSFIVTRVRTMRPPIMLSSS